MNQTALLVTMNLYHRRAIGQIQSHQGREAHAFGKSGHDAFAVGKRLGRSDNRRPEVRHDDGSRKLARRMRQYICHGGSVAQMQMPIVWSDKGDRLRIGRMGRVLHGNPILIGLPMILQDGVAASRAWLMNTPKTKKSVMIQYACLAWQEINE